MTSTTVSSSPSTTVFPSKSHPTILPNAHPYAIKTTSSAVLSRSNSSTHSAHSVKHHYVPPSPTRHRHRHTSSASSVEGVNINKITQPPPLPVPPSKLPSVSPTRAHFTLDEAIPRRLRRAETLPPTAAAPILNNNAIAEDDKLPRNPKHWSTDDLASYITTSLQACSELDTEDQRLLLHAIRDHMITGRDFLRLTDADLASLPFTATQRLYMLGASRALRADVLRGRVWVDSCHSKDIDIFVRSKDVYSQYIRGSSHPFNSDLYNSSTSSVDLLLPSSAALGAGGELPPSPPMTLNPSNSVSESSAQRYRDLAHMRIRRRGKVKGLVETWEREKGAVSGSEGSMSGSDAESDSDIPSTESPQLSNSTTSLSNPQTPYTSLKENDEEPTIEDLLTSSGLIEGARAWEEDCGMGETVKRISTSALAPLPSAPKGVAAFEINAESTEYSFDRNPSKFSVSGSGRANKQKRVVTAIFTGSSDGRMDTASETKPVDEVPPTNTDMGEIIDIHDNPEIGIAAVAVPPSDDDAIIIALEASIKNTREQLETFRVRLEVVEAQIATQDVANQAQFHPEDDLRPLDERQPNQSFIRARVPDTDDFILDYNLGLKNFARSIIARTMGWIYPYSHPIAHPLPDAKAPRSREASYLAIRPRFLLAFRLPYMVMFSFVFCAAVLRKVAFGKDVRGR